MERRKERESQISTFSFKKCGDRNANIFLISVKTYIVASV